VEGRKGNEREIFRVIAKIAEVGREPGEGGGDQIHAGELGAGSGATPTFIQKKRKKIRVRVKGGKGNCGEKLGEEERRGRKVHPPQGRPSVAALSFNSLFLKSWRGSRQKE